MRIVIDLQSCPSKPSTLASVQDLVRQMASSDGQHEVWITLSNRQPEAAEQVRHAFTALLPRNRVRVYELPTAGRGNSWRNGAASPIRLNFLLTLAPDVVYLPDAPEPGNQLPESSAPFATVNGSVDVDDVLQQLKLAAAARPATAAPEGRVRLAYISPLPPVHSGIADYSAELVPELARFYDIELIVDQDTISDVRLDGKYPVRTVAWFEEHGGEFDRVLYHFGNSGAHQHMFDLIRRHPGIVVLHDFYLSGVLDNLERDNYLPQGYLKAMYESHGYTGLLDHAKIGRNPSIWKYPVNKGVLDNASGVIVHSEFGKQLARQWYGADSAADWLTVPLLRGRHAHSGQDGDRAAARARLGLAEDDFLICTFGMLGRTKLNEELLDAFLGSPLAADPHCRLVFVGANDPGLYGAGLEQRMKASVAAKRIAVTGFVEAQGYADYLAASDVCVQLRANTRGETSAAVLDCLLYGAPTIVNAHGSTAELPDHLLLKLDDKVSVQDLGAALVRLHGDAALRTSLSQAALAHMQAHHAPEHVGRQYADAIEQITRQSSHSHYRALLNALPPVAEASDQELSEAAQAIAFNQPPRAPRQLLVDVSALVQSDPRTGIQRVVRSVLLAMFADPPPGFRIEPVFSHGGNRGYQYARAFTMGMLGVTGLALEDTPIDLRPGDVFLGLDLFTTGTSQNEELLQSMRARGLEIHFVVYDILPLQRPDVFSFGTEMHFGKYIDTVAAVSDGVVCISRAVAEDLRRWLASKGTHRLAPLAINYFHLGADLEASAPTTGLPADADKTLAEMRAHPSFLMVGTVEPRKGHKQALAAFDLMWEQGEQVNLVIVGREGWMVESLVEQLNQHPQRGRHLFWLQGISDEMLTLVYGAASALLAASEGEGFGLPLIEAAQHKLPILARDLPVFREVAGEHAHYFDGLSDHALAEAVRGWLKLQQAGTAPGSAGMRWLTWDQSAHQLLQGIGVVPPPPTGMARARPQLLVDVSTIAQNDLQTGIERVVRAQLMQLLRHHGDRFAVTPVYLDRSKMDYRHALRYKERLLGMAPRETTEEVVQLAPGDIFYSADYCPDGIAEAARHGVYARWRAAGVQVTFLIHDVLPVLRPEFFPVGADGTHGRWLKSVAGNADRLVCISQAVADETRDWLVRQGHDRADVPLAVVHHGADLDASAPTSGVPEAASALLGQIAGSPSFLMIGTIEPRKGHMQTILAFERLWAQGSDAKLIIVGKAGWGALPAAQRRTIPAIVAKLENHPESGKRLFWLSGVSDEFLEQLYGAASCLLSPSEGEGFGLPLIEAARHGVPLIVRDLQVFREVAGDHAHYFSGLEPQALADAVTAWLALQAAGKAPASSGIARRTWRDNADELVTVLSAPAV